MRELGLHLPRCVALAAQSDVAALQAEQPDGQRGCNWSDHDAPPIRGPIMPPEPGPAINAGRRFTEHLKWRLRCVICAALLAILEDAGIEATTVWDVAGRKVDRARDAVTKAEVDVLVDAVQGQAGSRECRGGLVHRRGPPGGAATPCPYAGFQVWPRARSRARFRRRCCASVATSTRLRATLS